MAAMSTQTVPRPRAFSTAALPEQRQVELWEEHNAAALIALSCTPPRGARFEAVEVNLELPRLHLARVRGSSHLVDRSAALVESDPADAIAVYVALRGEAVLEHLGRRRTMRPGQVLVCDADRPFVRGFGHGLDELAVKVPRATFTEATGLASLPAPVVVERTDDRHASALARLVGRALRVDHPVSADEQTLLDLISVVAGGRTTAARGHRAAARAVIDERYADPRLSAADVATAVGLSERQLSRVLADAGTTVPREVLARRLDAAHHLLASGAFARTADVAARCGFTSTAYFAQAFRRRFGVRAGDVRRGKY